MLSGERFGAAGSTVVLEERLLGAELSLHALCDGERFVLLPAAQDHKRIGDGDRGPNTGGMGTYAPAPLATPELLQPSGEHALCVVLAAANYPETPRTGDRIEGLAEAERVEGVRIHHAGTRLQDGAVVSAGGRVLGVTARGESLAAAHARAYEAVSHIHFDGMQYRTDIAARAMPGSRR
jgi:phosphoribosylamine-glycine ligase